MMPDYFRVKPTSEAVVFDGVPEALGSLHNLDSEGSSGVIERLNPLHTRPVPTFEFLAISGGGDDSVEFYYGADDHADTLETRLRTVYPDTFDIERVDYDPVRTLVPPEIEFPGEMSRDEFVETVIDGGNRQHEEISVVPVGVEWYGDASRKQDWMTTLHAYTGKAIAMSPDEIGQPPLAALIDTLTEIEAPAAFQVVFQQKSDWSTDAAIRKANLKEGRDTLGQWVVGGVLGIEDPPETGDTDGARVETIPRLDEIERKHPKRTFTGNVRTVAVPVGTEVPQSLDSQLDAVASVFDSLAGEFYELAGRRLRAGGFRQKAKEKAAWKAFTRLVTREIVTGRGKTRRGLVLTPTELADLVVVPSARQLSIEGTRGTRAEQQSRNPLPRPHSGILEAFREGMTIGHALDETGDPEDEPTCIPPHLLPFHVGRFAMTGAGKSVALINDALSLYDQTDGPVFLIDSKGGNLPEHYMRAHAKRFGVDDLEENVVHFAVPEMLPGFAFFDIRQALENGVRRVDAVQHKADHYEEIIKLVMGPERYEQAVASPNLIKYLIKAMYDEEHGLENGHFREDVDYFTHDQLENAVTQYHAAGPPGATPEDAPQSNDPQVAEKLERHLHADSTTFANVVSGVSNRMDYITQDAHLRRIFNNTESRFDFQELLDDHQVVIFDLGELRDEAAQVMTGVILTALYDAITRRDADEFAAKPEEYVANLLIDEAASVVISDTLTTLLERGREFQLSVELVTQFPEQMQEAGNREVYLNVLNNVGSPLVGKIAVDADIAEALAHEEVDPVEFKNRISSLPRGEWIGQLPSPEFGETGPEPFSVAPLPMPAGHPESDQPLTEREEDRFQEALDTVHDRTQAEFGVPEWDGPPSRETVAEVAVADADDRSLEVVMAEAIRAVQLREEGHEANGWVSVERVDEEVLDRIDSSEVEHVDPEALPEVRDSSRLIEVDLHPDGDAVVTRLTEEGEVAAEPDTGTGPSAGGDAHDEALLAIEDALTALDFSVEILTQDGAEQPDAIATHPDIDVTFSIEAATTTYDRPVKVLANLRKAQDAGHLPVFVVSATGEDHSGVDLAERVANILGEPVRQLASGETRFYTRDDAVTFEGGAEADGGVTAVRPATGESRRSHWGQDDEELVLRCEEEAEHARVRDFECVSKDQFPAVYSVDVSTGEYTVIEPGELPHVYESREAFETDWVPIKHPFVPESELPVPEYTSASYAIVILGQEDGDGGAVVFDPDDGRTRPLETLVEDAKMGTLRLAGSAGATHEEASMDDDTPEDTDDESAGEGDTSGVGAFAAAALVEADDGVVAVEEVYQAYKRFATARGYSIRGKTQFTQALKQHVSIERDRRSLDGEVRRCYVGIDLRIDGENEPSQGDGASAG